MRVRCEVCNVIFDNREPHKCPPQKKARVQPEKRVSPRPSALAVQVTRRKEKSSTERTRRYRERHGEEYKERRKLYMRKWRAQREKPTIMAAIT